MMTSYVLARVLIASGLTALIGAALAQDATADAVTPAPRAVRVVYPAPFGDRAPTPVQSSPSAPQPPAAATPPQDSAPVTPAAAAEPSVPTAPSAAPAPRAALVLPSTAQQAEAPALSTAPNPNLVDINTASVDELNGLGGRFGRAIIAGRPYQSIDELVSRRILTRAVFSQIKDQITTR